MILFLFKSILILAVLFVLYKMLLEREKMHRFNRFYLLAALLVSLALPCISLPLYVADEAAPAPIESIAEKVQHSAEIAEAHKTISYQPIRHNTGTAAPPKVKVNYLPYLLCCIYGLITLLLAVRFVYNITRFYILAARGKKIKLAGATVVLLQDCPLPYTFMNFIFVNAEQYEGQAIEKELLTHELTHVRQKHTMDILFIELLKTALWFNPLLYLYKKAIQTNHEFLADEAVIHKHLNIPTYQLLLLDKATPPLAYALASSINFSTTKKRFAMMTKTTSKTRGMLLRSAVVPVAIGLIYLFSVETIAYSKAPDGTFNPVLDKPLTEKLLPEVVAAAEKADSAIAEAAILQPADTIAGDARRDEYFKGVRIVIDDKQRGVSVNAPYEKVSEEYKRYYLNDIPEKKSGKPISDSDYQFTITQKNAVYYIDERKVTLDEVLKYKKEDFVSCGFKSYGTSKPGEGMVSEFQMFLFTRPFFEKKLKHISDRYPDKVYIIKVTDKPVDTYKEEIAKANETGVKTDLELYEDQRNDNMKKEFYPYADELRDEHKKVSPQFPGGNDAFNGYLHSNLKLTGDNKDKKLLLNFTVNTDGSISEVKVYGVDAETEKHIADVLMASPRWIPAQKNGKAAKSSYGTSIEP